MTYSSPVSVITAFYDLLNERKYKEAFACLTEEFRTKKWQGNFDDFAKGYTTMAKISDIACKEIKQDETSAEIDVTYSDMVRILHHPLIDPVLSDLTTPEAKENIKKFQQLLIDQKVATSDAIASTPLDSLSGDNTIEDYLWTLGADYSRIDELFAPETKIIRQHRIAACIKTPQGWLINDLKRD